jgi:hypothetical protein
MQKKHARSATKNMRITLHWRKRKGMLINQDSEIEKRERGKRKEKNNNK